MAHLYLMAVGGQRWVEQVAFRDALRAEPDFRQRYAALKQELAADHANDREAYTAGKANFIWAALAQRST